MFRKVNVPILGIIENMSSLTCPHCSNEIEVFSNGGGKAMADELGLVFLGKIPLVPAVVIGGDEGRPSVLEEGSIFANVFNEITAKISS